MARTRKKSDEANDKDRKPQEAIEEDGAIPGGLRAAGQELPLGFDPGKVSPIVNGTVTVDYEDCCAVGDDGSFFCSGTLIAPNLVITAKHCTGATRVFLKGNDVRALGDGEVRRVRKEFAHPTADIRVLVLRKKSSVAPRKISGGAVSLADNIRLVGFGNTDLDGRHGYGIKRMAEGVPITSVDCSEATDADEYGCRPGTEIVAGARGLEKDSCTGDSGGPLYVEGADGEYYLLGATSRGEKGSTNVCGDGGIYTRVDRFVDWIETETHIKVKRESD